jgi:hypothetical protein
MFDFQQQFQKIASFEKQVKEKLEAIKKLNDLDNINQLLENIDELREIVFKAKCEAELK